MSRYIEVDEIKRQWEIYGSLDVMDRILADVFPTVDAVPVVHGHWIDTGSGQECSVCGEIQYGYDSGRFFCQNCGAKMDEVTE